MAEMFCMTLKRVQFLLTKSKILSIALVVREQLSGKWYPGR